MVRSVYGLGSGKKEKNGCGFTNIPRWSDQHMDLTVEKKRKENVCGFANIPGWSDQHMDLAMGRKKKWEKWLWF